MRRFAALILGLAAVGFAQSDSAGAPLEGTIERIKVHGKALEGNLAGDSPDRDVAVYLPRSYKTSQNQRYPVVYMLHGGNIRTEEWTGFPAALFDKVIAAGTSKEMIVVTPNANTSYLGSFYANSITTGDWEHYVSSELVSYIDSHYRTIADRRSRGLAGYSMGGYGAIRIGMKHPEVF